jgi:hypothetical protein
MPTKSLTFDLTADSDGKVTGSQDVTPPLPVTLEKVVVRSTSGCNGRAHPLKAGFSGGATFDYDGQMIDCTDLEIDLGGVQVPAFTTTTALFELSGFGPGESVSLEGTLSYSLF